MINWDILLTLFFLVCIRGVCANVEGNTIMTSKSLDFILKMKKRGHSHPLHPYSCVRAWYCQFWLIFSYFRVTVRSCNPRINIFFRVYGFVTGNVFPKIVFHEKQYVYVPPTLLGDIQTSDIKFSANDIRMFLEYPSVRYPLDQNNWKQNS
jgi:hypothetical protein